jgi:hypothetical protein
LISFQVEANCRFVSATELAVTCSRISPWWAGYNRGCILSPDGPYERARNRLSSQIDEGVMWPERNDDDWLLSPHSFRGLVDCRTITHVVVPEGTQPIVPWFKAPTPQLFPTPGMDRISVLNRLRTRVKSGGTNCRTVGALDS